jgi:PST family polysaccharide transporter
MLMLGLAFSSSVILTSATQLIARVWVSHRLDIASAGYLQGCLAVASVYLGFVLTALGAEYYPRISALEGDSELSNRAVNEQVRIVLTLAAPVIVWMIVCAPVLLRILYNPEFQAAATLLRLLLVGDVFKLVGWCIGFLLLARQAKIKFFIAELSWNVFFLAVLLPATGRGLEVAGVAYATAYVLYAFASLALAKRETAFVLARGNRRVLAWVAVAVIATFATVESSSALGLPLALLIAGGCTAVAASRLLTWTRLSGEGAPQQGH